MKELNLEELESINGGGLASNIGGAVKFYFNKAKNSKLAKVFTGTKMHGGIGKVSVSGSLKNKSVYVGVSFSK